VPLDDDCLDLDGTNLGRLRFEEEAVPADANGNVAIADPHPGLCDAVLDDAVEAVRPSVALQLEGESADEAVLASRPFGQLLEVVVDDVRAHPPAIRGDGLQG
jgi:hypothetical protein